ncbi:MAG TPA: hypothetical protein EYO40_08895 [Phycisphaerales bacterium]|nr:hypothetical protein [Phycisphaerales bacterium]
MKKNFEHNVPLVTAFLDYLIDERAFSMYTGRCYGVDLRQYLVWITEEQNLTLDIPAETDAWQRYSNGEKEIAGHVGPETISEHIINADTEYLRSFLAYLAESNYSPATMARKIANDVRLLRARRDGEENRDPTKFLPLARTQQRD